MEKDEKKEKIWIIEDNAVHNTLLGHIIEDLGYEPVPFYDVESAREKLGGELPVLLISDIRIKDSTKSSLAFIRELSLNKCYKAIPVIIVSAYVSKEEIKEELPGYNTDNVIPKPFNIETISTKIKELLKKKK